MKKIRINTSSPYNVHIERGSLYKSGKIISEVIDSKKAVIVTDDTVDKLYSDILLNSLKEYDISADVFVFPHGEQSKNLHTLGDIFDFLCEKGITRSDFLIALGGGVVGDITGFAAASFLRGTNFVQIPTTLLAQVDSSVGGKTAVDIPGGKNLVGAFKQPALVICDSDTLRTLPESELACGMAEVIKYGMIRDKNLFEMCENHDMSNIHDVMDEIVYTCVDIKRQVVENDEFAKAALNMALGRGGDQAVIKDNEQFRFYGAATKEYEKSTRVKARVVSFALSGLISNADNVIVLTHKNADLDGLGAAFGLFRICKIHNKPISIAMEKYDKTVSKILAKIETMCIMEL